MSKKLLTLVAAVALFICLFAIAANAETMIFYEGEKGSGITCLQQELIRLGYLEGEADGVYGDGTSQAVMNYSRERDVYVQGGVSLSMIQCLYDDLHGGTMTVGSRGTGVYAVQQLLNVFGFLDDQPDGVFGENTRKAARAYMEYMADSAVSFFEQEVEERVAAVTTQPVYEDDIPDEVDIPLITAENVLTDGKLTERWLKFMFSGAAIGGRTTQSGDSGSDVQRLQRRLKNLNYLYKGTDGNFGDNTVRALKYFQRLNGLSETGVCDPETQKMIFSRNAIPSDQYVMPYMAKVSTTKNRVYIYGWTGAGYDMLVKEFTCTTGAKNTPTKKGTFQAVGPISEWYYMANSSVWVRYAFQIEGNYFFHSLLYSYKGQEKPSSTSVHNLGRNASHGCVRLALEDVKWIYENCTVGMTVEIT